MITHSSILARGIPWTEEPGRLQTMRMQRVKFNWMTNTLTFFRLHSSSLVAQMAKNPPAMQETQIRSLGQEDPLEKGMATHSCNLAWRILWTEGPGGLQPMGSQRVGCDRATKHRRAQLLLPLRLQTWAISILFRAPIAGEAAPSAPHPSTHPKQINPSLFTSGDLGRRQKLHLWCFNFEKVALM